MRYTPLLNYLLYQVGWFACVLGAASQRPLAGALVGVAMGAVHFLLCGERLIEARLVMLATVVGALVEMAQIATGTYRFASGTWSAALPPLWLLAMWAQFATTFRFSMRRVIARPVPAALFGAMGGPLAFLAGQRFGAVILLPPVPFGLLRLSVGWAMALLIFAAAVRRLEPGQNAPRDQVGTGDPAVSERVTPSPRIGRE